MQQEENTLLSSNGHMSTEEDSNLQSSSLIEHDEIEGTPFSAIKQNDKWFIAWGEYKISPEFTTRATIDVYIEENVWHLIAHYTLALIKKYQKERDEENKKLLKEYQKWYEQDEGKTLKTAHNDNK